MVISVKKENSKLLCKKRRLGRTQIWVSPICLGSLNLEPQEDTGQKTVLKALKNQIHFFDTSGKYGQGGSQNLIGEVLKEYLKSQPDDKNSLVFSTKISPLQKNPNTFQLTPESIESQISLSLKRLKISPIQIALLERPEQLLKTLGCKKKFLTQLKYIFEHLEVEVARGRISHYGLSTRAFLKKEDYPNHLNLQDIFDLAQSIKKNHHFSVIQIPFNLFETQCLFLKNQNGKSCLKKAKELDLGVMTYRSLTSFHRKKLHHLITFPGKNETFIKGELHEVLLEVIKMEKEILNKNIQPELQWGHQLRDHLQDIDDWWSWEAYIQKTIDPHIKQSMEQLPITDEWMQWKVLYLKKTKKLFTLITENLKGIANLRTNQISKYLNRRGKPI